MEAFAKSKGKFISGQDLADSIGCSRTAIWKHIDDLRRSGVEIEAVRKKGYRLIHIPDKLFSSEVLLGLETKTMGRNIYYFDSVESTQTIAHQKAAKGAPEGTLIIAEEQVKGKGRLSRSWDSAKEKGIWMSLIIRPPLPMEKAPQFTLIAAIALVQAIEQTINIKPEIKWPNDILINGKKISGILTEMRGEPDRINYLVIGIGINVNHELSDFPESLQEKATSLYIETGEKVARKKIIQVFLLFFEKYYNIYLTKGFSPLKIIWEAYVGSIGKNVTAKTLQGSITGKALGITEQGILMIKDAKGHIHYIYSADIDIHV